MTPGERRPELDGVRGIAILLVLVGHMDYRLAPLASAGVALFLVLSGYLITSILRAEHESHGRINFRRFYARRFTRLAPPLFVMLLVMGLLLRANWQQLLPAALWVTNYAGHLGVDVEPFGHTWSLSVEEQFYLVWPVALLAFLRLGDRGSAVLGGVICVLIGWRAALTANGLLDYAYSALETGGVPILAGCLIALAQWRLPRSLTSLATGGIVALASATCVVNSNLWWVTPLLIMPAAAALVAAARGAGWLAMRPLVLCGVASYSLYLWHKPVAWLVGAWGTPWGIAIGSAAGVLAYMMIEAPVMRWRSDRNQRVAAAVPQPAGLVGRSRTTESPH